MILPTTICRIRNFETYFGLLSFSTISTSSYIYIYKRSYQMVQKYVAQINCRFVRKKQCLDFISTIPIIATVIWSLLNFPSCGCRFDEKCGCKSIIQKIFQCSYPHCTHDNNDPLSQIAIKIQKVHKVSQVTLLSMSIFPS